MHTKFASKRSSGKVLKRMVAREGSAHFHIQGLILEGPICK